MKRSDAGVVGFLSWVSIVIGPDYRFIWMAIIYGVGISLLWLTVPLSVKLLINSVAAVDLATPLISLSVVLFVILSLLAALIAARLHLTSLLERRIYTRVVAEITLRAVHARDPSFEHKQKRELFNRYFDMIMAEKSLPSLLIGLFAILLEGVVGLVVTSFYHPYVFAFNAVLVVVLLAIWRIWAHEAIWTAVQQSEAKHQTAHWLQSLGCSNGFYKSSRHVRHAYARTETLSAQWLDRHKRHFRQCFSQSIAFLATFAIATAGFLALGGSLILAGQLSLGQLVAAELILSGIFYGIAQVTTYLPTLYEFAANLEETTRFWHIEQEQPRGSPHHPIDGSFAFRRVQVDRYQFDFAVAAGEQLAVVATTRTRRALIGLLRRDDEAARGIVTLGGRDIADYDPYVLRSNLIDCESAEMLEMSIREYLDLATLSETGEQAAHLRPSIMPLLEIVGLDRRIEELDDGLDTMMSHAGHPLTASEVMALRLVEAMLAQPKLLILSPVYDLLPAERVDAALARMRDNGTTVLQFTQRPADLRRDGWLWLGETEQRRFEDAASLQQAIGDGHAHSA